MKGIKITLPDITGEELSIEKSDDPELRDHVLDARNHVADILKQFREGIYRGFMDTNNKEQVVLDIGANIGLFALYVQSICKKIVCVEPVPKHLELLNTLTEGHKHISSVQAAITESNRTTSFFLAKTNTTMCSLVDHEYTKEAISVPGRTIKSIIDEFNLGKVDFCKIDIEGSEDTVIRHDQISSVKNTIGQFFIECHTIPEKDIWAVKHDVMKVFLANGYSVKTGVHYLSGLDQLRHQEWANQTSDFPLVENVSVVDGLGHDAVVANRMK